MRRLETGGLILGLFEHAQYEEESVQLEPGDVVVIFSDGVSEALSAAGEEFGDARILECVQAHRSASPVEILDCLLQTVKRFCVGAVQSDDVTALVVQYAA